MKILKEIGLFADILFRRIGWYVQVSLEEKMRAAIWNALKDLDDHSTFNFNFQVTNWGFHSTSLRMVGDGIEYYENNHGLVKFNTREEAVNFLAAHLLNCAKVANGEVTFITVYKLPYVNNPTLDVFKDLKIAELPKVEVKPIEQEKVTQPSQLTEAIDALQAHIESLRKQREMKGRIKANELHYLCDKLKSLPADKVKKRVEDILANREHSLMLNRGTGFYFFKSGFKSHSTTETLLQHIVDKAAAPTELSPLINS